MRVRAPVPLVVGAVLLAVWAVLDRVGAGDRVILVAGLVGAAVATVASDARDRGRRRDDLPSSSWDDDEVAAPPLFRHAGIALVCLVVGVVGMAFVGWPGAVLAAGAAVYMAVAIPVFNLGWTLRAQRDHRRRNALRRQRARRRHESRTRRRARSFWSRD